MNARLCSGVLDPQTESFFQQLMLKQHALGSDVMVGCRSQPVQVRLLGPSEDELRMYRVGEDPYVDRFDHYVIAKGVFEFGGVRRIDVARASRLWQNLVPASQRSALSFENMVAFARHFNVKSDGTEHQNSIFHSKDVF